MLSVRHHLFYLCMIAVLLLAINGCKKDYDVQTTQNNRSNDNTLLVQNTTSPSDPNDHSNPQTGKICETWGQIPLFKDNHIFVYDAKLENEACCDLDQDDPEWECDNDGNCTRELSFDIQCKTTLMHADSIYCESIVSCSTEGDRDLYDFSPDGHWFVDTNGIYRLSKDNAINLEKQPSPNKCISPSYIQCKSDTLAYEYTEFCIEIPLIPWNLSTDIDQENCDEYMCESFTLTHHGNLWEITSSFQGGDSVSSTTLFDETRGITEFTSLFSGGFERTFHAILK